jgi:hypothetical protein
VNSAGGSTEVEFRVGHVSDCGDYPVVSDPESAGAIGFSCEVVGGVGRRDAHGLFEKRLRLIDPMSNRGGFLRSRGTTTEAHGYAGRQERSSEDQVAEHT